MRLEPSGKGSDEGGVAGILHEVRLVVAKKDLGKGGGKLVMQSKLGYGKGLREVWGVAEGGSKAIAGIENGALSPVKGEVARADLVEGGLGGGVVGREWCEVGNGCGQGGTEEAFVVV